ncbi:MAG: CDP-archaeol synthase [Acidobacteria bacterium]|nr:CDP-archaeol synthase [Acidobacteriota bacterium]MBI3664188.1 CDP-archaeol synthase [Acidobacteriota bacterium]
MTGARILTAVVLIPIVVSLVLWGPTWLVAVVVAGIILLALHEFFAIGAKMNMPGYPRFTMLCALGIVWAMSSGTYTIWYSGMTRIPVLFRFLLATREFYLAFFLIGMAGLALATKKGVAAALPSAAVSAAGLAFIAWPLSYLVNLHASSPIKLLFVLVVVWVGDTAAFFVGRSMGKRLLAPTISPKKTWEGAVANVLGSLLAGAVFYACELAPASTTLLIHFLVAAVLVSVAGQMGDLLESTWKRGAEVKDSGSLLPGHGGILDRIDALLLAAPVAFWYFSLMAVGP